MPVPKKSKTTGQCRNCWAVRLCKDCFISAIRGDEFNVARKKKNCQARRDRLFEEMKVFVDVMDRYPGILDRIHYAEPDADVIKYVRDFIEKEKNKPAFGIRTEQGRLKSKEVTK